MSIVKSIRMPDFNGNDAFTVSAAELKYSPERTVRIVYELYGFEWASRLWQHWRAYCVPDMGVAFEIETDRRIRAWLEDRRPKPTAALRAKGVDG